MKYKCSIDDCLNKRTAKGLCQFHYDRYRSSNSKRKYQQLIKKCNDNNRKTNITEQQLQQITSQNCYYCGKQNKSTGHGLDRIDSSKDYLIHNVVSCCGNCNRAKSDLNSGDFFEMILNIYKNTERKVNFLYELSERD